MTDAVAPPPEDRATPAVAVIDQPRPAAVRIERLTKRYGNVNAVDSLDLRVPEGGVFGLIGPNGAGKTTTMEAIVTLLVPDGGLLRVFDIDPLRERRKVRELVGYMPDFFGVYDGLTCAEYLDFFASAYRLDAQTRVQQVHDLLELVELSHKADTDVSGLSRGMQQRLSLARSLVHDPKLLVLDEPASGLDPRARVELREIVLELARQGRTILISSHILSELQEVCDRVGIIEAGKVLAQGTADEIQEAVRTARTITVRVIGGEAGRNQAIAVATSLGAAMTGAGPSGGIVFELAGGEEAAADLLGALITAGVRVTDFREDAAGLERLFMSVTKGIVR